MGDDATAEPRGFWQRICEGWGEVWRVVFLCRFSVGFGLLVALLIVVPEQSREVLRVLAEDPWRPLPWLLTGIATPLLGLSAWYSGRLVLDLLAPDAYDAPGARGLAARHVPRLAGLVPVAAVALAFWLAAPGASEGARLIWALAGATTLLALALYVFLYMRRWLLRWWWRRRGGEAPARWPLRLFRDPHWRLLVLLIAVGTGLLLFYLLADYGSDRAAAIGAAALFLLWAAILMPLGTTLAWLGTRLRVPILTVLLAAAIAFTWLEVNDNHAVRQAEDVVTAACEAEVAAAGPGPVSVAARLEATLETLEARHPGRIHPLVVVAAQGGGARAAYQTAHMLGQIQDRCPAFGDHLLAISGVSGGSVGAAVFAATREATGSSGSDICDLVDALPTEAPTYTEAAETTLGRDLLAPVVGGLLFPDLVQRFLFWPIESFSRARALEAALERGFHEATGSCAMARPFRDLTAGPALLLNTTEVESGHRVVLSHLAEDENGRPFRTLDSVAPHGVPALSTAAVLSARFPFVTPAGTLDRVGGEGEGRRMRLVDGGYFENSGAATALDLLHALAEHHDPQTPRFRPVVLVIEADRCIDRGSREQARACMADPVAAQARTGFGELLSPVRALFATRTARGEVAKEDLDRLRGLIAHLAPAGEPLVLRLGIERRDVAIPLGWVLSAAARAEIRDQLGHAGLCDPAGDIRARNGCAQAALQELLAP